MKILVKVQEKKSIEKKLNENFSKSSSKKIYRNIFYVLLTEYAQKRKWSFSLNEQHKNNDS